MISPSPSEPQEPQGAETARRLDALPVLHGRRPLGRFLQRVIRALAEVVLPLGPSSPPPDLLHIGRFVARYTCHMPTLLRVALPLGLLTLELGAFVLAPSWKPFSFMSLAARKKYVNRWVHSRLRLFRDLIKGMKGICYLAYYSSPEVQRSLGYTPEEHVRLVTQERLTRYAHEL